MRVLLINPPSDAPNPVMPLGLACLAAVLEQAGISVEVIDAWAERYSFEDLGREVALRRPDMAGITMMSPFYTAAMRSVDIVRERTGALIVVGGPHPSALPEDCLADNAHIDFVVIGEGEQTLLDLVLSLEGQNKDPRSIAGIAFRQDGRIVTTGNARPIQDLDSLPLPARRYFPLEKYKTHPPYGKKNPYMTLITSRGCPFRCTYCSKSVFGNRYRALSPLRVVAEVKHIIQEFGVKEIHFYDDDFTIDPDRTAEICERLVRAKLPISWSCTTRVDLVNVKLLNKMKQAGCWMISYGVESADPTILRQIRKGYTLDTIQKAFRITREVGMRTIAYFMAGLPGENKKTLENTINFSLELNPDFVSWGITALYPGSPLYKDARMGKLGNAEIRYTYRDKSLHASGSPYGAGYAIIYEEFLARQELEAYVRRANRAFYLRARYLMRFLFKIRSWYEMWHFFKGGLQFLRWVVKQPH